MESFYKTIKEEFKLHSCYDRLWKSIEVISEFLDKMRTRHPDKYWDLKEEIHEVWNGPHYNKEHAERHVSSLKYVGHKYTCVGEYFHIDYIKDIHIKHKGIIPLQYNCYDIYVALNYGYYKHHKHFTKEREHEFIIMFIKEYLCEKEDGKIWNIMTESD